MGCGSQKEVDSSVLEVAFAELIELGEADDLSVEVDRKGRGVVAAFGLLHETFGGHVAPPARDRRLRTDLGEARDVAGLKRA